jgi:SAM-dependent methyltransferase
VSTRAIPGSVPNPQTVFDEVAACWDDYTRDNFFNAFWERPAVLRLLPEALGGKKILDAGCGTGYYTGELLDRGAEVHAVDISQKMVQVCRAKYQRRGGNRLQVERRDLESPLHGLAENSFAGIVASLVIHYVRDLRRLFGEFYRILCPSGFFLFSTNHPFWNLEPRFAATSYFATELVLSRWDLGNQKRMDVLYYRRPLMELLNPLQEAKFELERLDEPMPDPRAQHLPHLEKYNAEYGMKPVFLVIKVRKPG